jgi:pimeloyl-ACP methyl ester carboxylesterase
MLDEERVRDQLSAAEELHYVGHSGPALIAAGAALAGVLRLRGGALAGPSASGGALLEALLATRVLTEAEHDLLYRLLRAHQRLTLGYVPENDASLSPLETAAALALMVHMLEGLHLGPLGI